MSEAEETYEENGRLYHIYQRGLYWLPHDDHELERLDIFHNLLYNDDKLNLPLHRTPLRPKGNEAPRILDMGCGTGFWAIDMADRYTKAEVIGVDLANIQPHYVPRNVTFMPHKNFNDGFWPFADDHFDLIHLSMITACVVDWPAMYAKVYRHLQPGTGHIEHLEFDIKPTVIGGTLRPDSYITKWYEDVVTASAAANRPIAYDPELTHTAMYRAGFVDIAYQKIPVPWHFYRRAGENYQIGGTFHVTMVHGKGLEAYCMAPFTKVNRWTKEQVTQYVELVKSEIRSSGVQLESYIYIWSGRRP